MFSSQRTQGSEEFGAKFHWPYYLFSGIRVVGIAAQNALASISCLFLIIYWYSFCVGCKQTKFFFSPNKNKILLDLAFNHIFL